VAFTFGDAISLAGFATDRYKQRVSFNEATLVAKRQNDRDAINDRNRNTILQINNQLRGEQTALEGIAAAYDMQDIAWAVRRRKATAMAERAGGMGISGQNYAAHFRNIERHGLNAGKVRMRNYGTRVRNIEIEGHADYIKTLLANLSTDFVEGPSQTGLQLAGIGLGISAVKEIGFTVDPKTGKKVSRF